MENALSERMVEGESPLDQARGDPERAHAGTRVEGSKGMTPAPARGRFFVYILECSDGTLYVGSTSDPDQRVTRHNDGLGARHTAVRGPSRIAYCESHDTLTAARRREIQLKHWSRAKKQALIAGDAASLHALAKRRRLR